MKKIHSPPHLFFDHYKNAPLVQSKNRCGGRAKKSLGQNFLKSEMALKKIIETGEISEEDVVLEIGPGKGSLTKKLLEKAGTVIAVEKDESLFQFLQEKFSEEIKNKKLILIENDCLKFNPKNYNLETRTYKLISNIPYNITGAILKKFLTERNQPSMMILMVQHEVAKRIIGKDGKATPQKIKSSGVARSAKSGFRESILSISVKVYGTPKMIMKVPARYFSPQPNVDSAIISIKNISRRLFKENKIAENVFWEIVRTGFAHKRKKLGSNLKNLSFYHIESKPMSDIGKTHVINKKVLESLKNKRAEDLSLEDWVSLIKNQ